MALNRILGGIDYTKALAHILGYTDELALLVFAPTVFARGGALASGLFIHIINLVWLVF